MEDAGDADALGGERRDNPGNDDPLRQRQEQSNTSVPRFDGEQPCSEFSDMLE